MWIKTYIYIYFTPSSDNSIGCWPPPPTGEINFRMVITVDDLRTLQNASNMSKIGSYACLAESEDALGLYIGSASGELRGGLKTRIREHNTLLHRQPISAKRFYNFAWKGKDIKKGMSLSWVCVSMAPQKPTDGPVSKEEALHVLEAVYIFLFWAHNVSTTGTLRQTLGMPTLESVGLNSTPWLKRYGGVAFAFMNQEEGKRKTGKPFR